MNAAGRRLSLLLGLLQLFIALGAIAGGLALTLDPSGRGMGWTLEQLASTPFPDFLIPGLFLLIVNGLGSLAGAVLSLRRHAVGGPAAVALGGILMAWIAIQVGLIGLVSWLQPFYFVLGLLEAALGYLLWRSGG